LRPTWICITAGGRLSAASPSRRELSLVDAAVLVDNDADSEELVRSLPASRYRLLASVEQDETGGWQPFV
jgi:hypothetical protein